MAVTTLPSRKASTVRKRKKSKPHGRNGQRTLVEDLAASEAERLLSVLLEGSIDRLGHLSPDARRMVQQMAVYALLNAACLPDDVRSCA